MNRIQALRAFCIIVLAIAGCSQDLPRPTKEIQVPAGGDPVLTTSERAALEAHTYPTSAIARASFEEPQPIAEPKPLKPLEMWTEQEAAADALGRIGAAAVPELVVALENSDPAVRHKAVGVLGRIGPDATAAVPSLVKLLNDPDPEVRKATVRTLGQIGPAAKDAVPDLVETLLQPSP
jgi:HEAT repeat protein